MSEEQPIDLIDPLDELFTEEDEKIGATTPGFSPQSLYMEPIPEASEENLVCLRGPCKYYVEIVQRFDAGNTAGTLENTPKLTNRYCSCISGRPIDLTDSCIYSCSHWDPVDPEDEERIDLELRREKYNKSKTEEE